MYIEFSRWIRRLPLTMVVRTGCLVGMRGTFGKPTSVREYRSLTDSSMTLNVQSLIYSVLASIGAFLAPWISLSKILMIVYKVKTSKNLKVSILVMTKAFVTSIQEQSNRGLQVILELEESEKRRSRRKNVARVHFARGRRKKPRKPI